MSMTAENPFPAKSASSLGLISNLASGDTERSRNCLSLLTDTDEFIRRVKVPRVSDTTFVADGIPCHTSMVPDGKTSKLVIWCTLGYLPYSVVSVEKRRALIYILESLHYSPDIKFGVDDHMRIVVSASYMLEMPPSAHYIFFPLIQFMQKARPYMRLIGEYL